MTIDSLEERDVIAGGPLEIVVVTTLDDHTTNTSHREVWVFSIDHGVPVSLNPLDGVDPATLVTP